jgi:hypothetical protein
MRSRCGNTSGAKHQIKFQKFTQAPVGSRPHSKNGFPPASLITRMRKLTAPAVYAGLPFLQSGAWVLSDASSHEFAALPVERQGPLGSSASVLPGITILF